MESNFDKKAKVLYDEVIKLLSEYRTNHKERRPNIDILEDFKKEFFSLVDKVNLRLMEDKDNFYGYFLFQMSREISFDLSSPTGVNFNIGLLYVSQHKFIKKSCIYAAFVWLFYIYITNP